MQPRRHGREPRGHRSRSRTIPLSGDETGEGEGDWYACWSCGMPNNDVEDFIDDGASKVHTTFSDYAIQATGGLGLRTKVHLNLGVTTANRSATLRVARANADGSAKTVVHAKKIVDTKGCPNDGNLNWRGDE